jgi:peptide/nickel transport system permease protein
MSTTTTPTTTTAAKVAPGAAEVPTQVPIGIPAPGEPVPMEAPTGRADRASRSFFRQAIIDTWTRPAAKAGLVWIAVVVFLAVFAPFIANSHPILMKTADGKVASPLLRYLTPNDVLLLVATATIAFLLTTRRLNFGPSLLVLFGVLAVATPLAFWLVRPPVTAWYEGYRARQASGEIASAKRTVIPYSPLDRNRDAPAGEHPAAPSAMHWVGTEQNGADMLSQMIHASRIALSIGFVSTGIAVLIGITIGGLMGYFAGPVDLLGMRLIEIFEALPRLLLLLAVAALVSKNLYVLMAVIGLTGWTGNARFIRAEFLKLRKQDFVQAAIASGLPLRSILFRHMLPNGIAPVLITSSFGVASAILLESTLSFLGLGDPDQPSWGQLLNQARSGGAGFHWWIAVFPGLAIFLTVFSYNLIGEAIRDAIDPKLRKRD